jgi:hypothetical protein
LPGEHVISGRRGTFRTFETFGTSWDLIRLLLDQAVETHFPSVLLIQLQRNGPRQTRKK